MRNGVFEALATPLPGFGKSCRKLVSHFLGSGKRGQKEDFEDELLNYFFSRFRLVGSTTEQRAILQSLSCLDSRNSIM